VRIVYADAPGDAEKKMTPLAGRQNGRWE
jgi:hypothetical protein